MPTEGLGEERERMLEARVDELSAENERVKMNAATHRKAAQDYKRWMEVAEARKGALLAENERYQQTLRDIAAWMPEPCGSGYGERVVCSRGTIGCPVRHDDYAAAHQLSALATMAVGTVSSEQSEDG